MNALGFSVTHDAACLHMYERMFSRAELRV